MTLLQQPQRRKARRFRDIQRHKSALGVAARERNRMARMADAGQWRQVGTWRTCAATVGRVFREAAERRKA